MFPEDVNVEILSRLDVVSLLRSKCVSKSWYNLISSEYFIKIHLRYSTNNKNSTHHHIVSHTKVGSLMFWSLNSLLNNLGEVIDDKSFRCDFRYIRESYTLVGCCNGLLCVFNNAKEFFLWNPSTRVHKKLPSVSERVINSSGKPRKLSVLQYGFGINKSNNEYKVITICSRDDDDDDTFNNLVVQVYSLKTNCWKTLEVVLPFELVYVYFNGKAVFANGKLYWAKITKDHPSGGIPRSALVSFDFESELLEKEEQFVVDQALIRVGLIDGCLSGLYYDTGRTHMELWKLKQEGERKPNWSVIVGVPYFLDLNEIRTPLCMTRDGKFFFFGKGNFEIYDPKTYGWRSPLARCFAHSFGDQTVLYIPSLVSLT